MKDRLFLLAPGFTTMEGGPFYCGDSVGVEGLLSFFPALRDEVDVVYCAAPRPRAEIVALIGEGNQSVPVLVLSPETAVRTAAISVFHHEDMRFINDPAIIRQYLSTQYGVAEAA